MACLTCENLKRTLEARREEYVAACASVCYRINKRAAAHKNVEMERAKYELEEHWSVCTSSRRPPVILPQREVAKGIRQVAA